MYLMFPSCSLSIFEIYIYSYSDTSLAIDIFISFYRNTENTNVPHPNYSFPANIYPHSSTHLPYACRNIWHLVSRSIYVTHYIFKAFYKQHIIMGISLLSHLFLCMHPTLYIGNIEMPSFVKFFRV